MKKSKILIFIIFILMIVLATFFVLLSQFYFNELELGFRKNFRESYLLIEKAEQNITLRQQGSKNFNNEAFITLGEEIEDELKNAIVFLDEAATYNKKQGEISFLLPKKYKNYLEFKNNSFDNYYQLLKDFYQRKQNEHMMTKTILLVVQISQSIYDLKNYQEWTKVVDGLPQNSKTIKFNADTLLTNKYINQEFYDYIVKTLVDYNRATQLLSNAAVNESYNIDFSELKAFKTPEIEIKRMTENLKTDWNNRYQDYLDNVTKNDQDLFLTNNYFNENKLALDPISRFFAVFSNKFPKIKINENYKQIFAPKNIPTELLS